MRVVQLVPTLPPPAEGVGSYALALAQALAEQRGIASRFLAGDPAWTGAEAEGVPAAPVTARRASALAADLTAAAEGAAAVLVHYVNYAYQRRGCPAWLVLGLERWRAGAPGRRLVTMFHEVYATGLPWQSSFWLMPVQRRLARRLLAASDAAVTSLALYVRRLGGGEVPVWPVFSTVGEPATLPGPGERAPRLVVFGGRGTRRRAWTARRADLAAACRELGIEEVCDVGPPLEVPTAGSEVDGVPVRRLGLLPGAEVSALFAEARAGFLAYPPDFLAKSTIFAAYCAHGLVPVCAWSPPLPLRETGMTELYWRPGAARDPREVATAARKWYEGHSLSRQTEMFRGLVSS